MSLGLRTDRSLRFVMPNQLFSTLLGIRGQASIHSLADVFRWLTDR